MQFDYRILHRGTANRTSLPRPYYVLTFGKKWYKDTLNYPRRSLYAKRIGSKNDDSDHDDISKTFETNSDNIDEKAIISAEVVSDNNVDSS